MKFKIGDRVRVAYDFFAKGTIIPSKNKKINVKWDNGYSSDDISEKDLLLIDAEADQELARSIQSKVDEATHSLEKAFDLLKQAKKMSHNQLVNNDDINLCGLEKVIDENGWRSSSLFC